jgi:hypothetical protein
MALRADAVLKAALGYWVLCSGSVGLRNNPDEFPLISNLMYARKIRVEYQIDGNLQPCPLKWLDSFSMRNFTNASLFDDTLPAADGEMEIGSKVPVDQLREAMQDWFRRKGYLAKDTELVVNESR